MSATTDRENVISLAKHNPEAALIRARKIRDPWFRCQALAWTARLIPEKKLSLKVVGEALKAAWSAPDPYRAVGASAWPVRALIERGWTTQAQAAMKTALEVAPRIEHRVSRADALLLLFQAVFPLGSQARAPTMAALVSACSAAGVKGQLHLRTIALMLAAEDRAAAIQLVSTMRDGPERRQAEQRLAEGESWPPRSFFE